MAKPAFSGLRLFTDLTSLQRSISCPFCSEPHSGLCQPWSMMKWGQYQVSYLPPLSLQARQASQFAEQVYSQHEQYLFKLSIYEDAPVWQWEDHPACIGEYSVYKSTGKGDQGWGSVSWILRNTVTGLTRIFCFFFLVWFSCYIMVSFIPHFFFS